MKRRLSSEQGFTLIELLTVVGIIGILAYLGIVSFDVYKSRASYSNAIATLHNARNALEVRLNDQDNPPGAVPLTTQSTQGAISDPTLASLLPGMQIPMKTNLSVSYDPSCVIGGCQSDLIEVDPCLGREHVQWIRFGDGVDILLEHVDQSGC
jgi:prepilin-type N-terminal cleavage/methylation domain-containing protein